MSKILPLILFLIGTGAGVGAGVFLRPDPVLEVELAAKDEDPEVVASAEDDELPADGKEYVKLSNQFVVPIVEKERISSMVVMTLSVEVPAGRGEDVYDLEPKIRDEFLRVLFDHAAIGGFEGAFLNNENLDTVRSSLSDTARMNFGNDFISDVLIFEIARQDY